MKTHLLEHVIVQESTLDTDRQILDTPEGLEVIRDQRTKTGRLDRAIVQTILERVLESDDAVTVIMETAGVTVEEAIERVTDWERVLRSVAGMKPPRTNTENN